MNIPPKLWGKCGWVRFYIMKIHIMLKALSNLQAYTDDLRIYEKRVIMEQGKLGILRVYSLWNSDKENANITYLNPSESGGMKQ